MPPPAPHGILVLMKKEKHSGWFEDQIFFDLPQEGLDDYPDETLFAPFRVTDIGYYPCAKNHYRKRENGCDEIVFILCTAGGGRYRVDDGETIPVKAGQAFALPARVPHEYEADADTPWSIYWMHFKGTQAQALCAFLLGRPRPLDIGAAHREEAARLMHNCFGILREPYQQQEYFAVCQYALSVLATVGLACKKAGVALSEKGGHGVERAVAFMQEHLSGNVTLPEIAAAAGFSTSHLHALFRAATGHAPMEYYLRMKMQAAGRELYFSNRSVKEIAAQFGMVDSCYFSRIFKKVMGVSPLAYRRLSKG